MKKHYFLSILLSFLVSVTFVSCGSDDNGYTEVPTPQPEPDPVSPVVLDLNAVPYANLSDYKFYEGPMKNLAPAYKVIPYDLNSTLFTDYAHKKRFIWMPAGQQATYDGDGKVINFPTGTVLIKNFYYDNVQPANTTQIIETRLMIKKADGWIFANYVWNEAQTEASLNTDGGTVDIAWLENGMPKSTSYNIPPQNDCFTCHKINEIAIPIGPKPQNLNKNYSYAGGTMNQLSKWIQEGYLANSVPGTVASTLDWTDTTKPVDQRMRSYLDINCAHCHSDGAHCDYMAMRLSYTDTSNPTNIGVCVTPFESDETYLVAGRNVAKSAMHARMITNVESRRMPLLGRTIVHNEAVQLMEEYINSLETCD